MTETNSKVQLNIFLWVLQTARTCPNERFERNDFLSSLSNSNFFRTLSGRNQAVLWKPNSTRADEPMKKDISIRSSSIPKKVFGIWRRYFGFRLKHFSMAGDTALYAFKEWTELENFRNNFCFLIITGLWVKPFLILGRIFQIVLEIAFYVFGDIWR